MYKSLVQKKNTMYQSLVHICRKGVKVNNQLERRIVEHYGNKASKQGRIGHITWSDILPF
jgi:hypothetical protein